MSDYVVLIDGAALDLRAVVAFVAIGAAFALVGLIKGVRCIKNKAPAVEIGAWALIVGAGLLFLGVSAPWWSLLV